MGRIQKVRMLKRTPRRSYKYSHIFDKVSEQRTELKILVKLLL